MFWSKTTRVIGFGLLWFLIALLTTSLFPLAEVMNGSPHISSLHRTRDRDGWRSGVASSSNAVVDLSADYDLNPFTTTNDPRSPDSGFIRGLVYFTSRWL